MMETITLTQSELDNLPEYSLSVPTGKTIGKRWKHDQNTHGHHLRGEDHNWFMGEYIKTDDPVLSVGVKYRKINIIP